jgi:hypothetical protein
MTRGPKIAQSHPRIVPRKRTASLRRTTARISSRLLPGIGERGQQIHLEGGLNSLAAKKVHATHGGDLDQFVPLPSTFANLGLLMWMQERSVAAPFLPMKIRLTVRLNEE